MKVQDYNIQEHFGDSGHITHKTALQAELIWQAGLIWHERVITVDESLYFSPVSLNSFL